MLRVGLTGGIASGKSTVGAMLAEMGAHLVDSDHLARRAVEPGSPGLARVEEAFGRGVLDSAGSLDRARLRQIVFNDAAQRERLNRIVHPLVADMVNQELARLERADPTGVAVVDVPLLFEVGWQGRFDCTVLVYVPPAKQVQRLRRRDGMSAQAAQAALGAQMPIEDKRGLADFLVDNSGSVEETRRQVEGLWARLRGLAGSAASRKKSDPS